jgi:GxxExxY protein
VIIEISDAVKERINTLNENEIGAIVVDCAVQIHMELGPGLLETVYEIVLAHQLQAKGLKVERQVPVPIVYQGIHFDEGFRADIIVDNKVILELKSVERVSKAQKKQVLTYLKLADMKLGFLLNFGAARMKEGISQIIKEKLIDMVESGRSQTKVQRHKKNSL